MDLLERVLLIIDNRQIKFNGLSPEFLEDVQYMVGPVHSLWSQEYDVLSLILKNTPSTKTPPEWLFVY